MKFVMDTILREEGAIRPMTRTGAPSEDYLMWRKGSGNTVEIYDIAVYSERRNGNGRLLVNYLIDHLPPGTRTLWAITKADNFIAQQFYESLNFRVIGTLRSFYQDSGNTVDAIMYGRDINLDERLEEGE